MSYCEKDRKFGDVFIDSLHTKLHIMQAARKMPLEYTIDDVIVHNVSDRLDMESGLDSMSYVVCPKHGTKLPLLNGVIQFRFQRETQHKYLNVTISYEYANGKHAEFHKSCASIGIFGTCHQNDAPNAGYSYFVIYDMARTIDRIKARNELKRSDFPEGSKGAIEWLRNKERIIKYNQKPNYLKNETFLTVKLAELARIGVLTYVGIDPAAATAEDGSESLKLKSLLGEFYQYPDIANDLTEKGFWRFNY